MVRRSAQLYLPRHHPAKTRFSEKTTETAAPVPRIQLKPRGHDLILRATRIGHSRITAIARRPHNAPPQRDTGPRINERIRAPEIRLIGADGENVGVISPSRALAMAEEAGLDLVEISPTAEPPVCKIMDYGKFKYEQQKREAEARKKQKIIEIKEIKFRPGTDTHDYDVKMRSVMKFLSEGDKVKVTLRFRGREMAHQQLGIELLNRVASDVGEAGKVEKHAETRRSADGDDDRPEVRQSPVAFPAPASAGAFRFRSRDRDGA
ncbi:MAG: translation initiation factor IF-3 [Paenirhodobacter sp.]